MFASTIDISLFSAGMVDKRINDFESLASSATSAITLASLVQADSEVERKFNVPQWISLKPKKSALQPRRAAPASTPAPAPAKISAPSPAPVNSIYGEDYLTPLNMVSAAAIVHFRQVSDKISTRDITPCPLRDSLEALINQESLWANNTGSLDFHLSDAPVARAPRAPRHTATLAVSEPKAEKKSHGAFCKTKSWCKKVFGKKVEAPFVYTRPAAGQRLVRLNKKQLATLDCAQRRQYNEDIMEAEIAADNRRRDAKRARETFINANGLY